MDKLLAASFVLAFASTVGAQAATPAFFTQAGPVVYTENAASADSFAGAAGFDANYADHAYPPLVTTELEWSGVRHLRDSGGTSELMISVYADLGRHGIKHSIGLLRGFSADTLNANLKAFVPYVDFVEPANEADNFKDPNWSQMRTDQFRLYRTVRANAAYDRIAVLGPSFADSLTHAPLVGPLDAYEDFGQIHDATCDWEPSTTLFGGGILENIAKLRPTTVYKNIWTTETGYTDDFKRGCSLPDDNISRYIPRELALRFEVKMRTYFNRLVVRPDDIVFGGLGMLETTGVPKPQFLTLGNLVRLTTDPGRGIAPRRVTFALSGATPDVAHLALARKDGSFDLLLWREVTSWDHRARKQIPVPAEGIKVFLPGGYGFATMAKVNPSYGDTITHLRITNGATGAIPIDDRITVLHLFTTAAQVNALTQF